ncbi:MAG: hypothetical protein HKN72_09525 [Gemmatimonadetes bacterium]|nr:hypothetical protein [Gemmatimonadota bacterium]
MPVPTELRPFFTSLVDKSRKSEINWEADGHSDAYRVRFTDFAIGISQDERKPVVLVRLFNDREEPTTVIEVTQADEEWIGAVSLINSANLKVRRVGQTLHRALEELGKDGPIGLGSKEA